MNDKITSDIEAVVLPSASSDTKMPKVVPCCKSNEVVKDKFLDSERYLLRERCVMISVNVWNETSHNSHCTDASKFIVDLASKLESYVLNGNTIKD